jgi:flagella basal body P-ring formation protein FlgA
MMMALLLILLASHMALPGTLRPAVSTPTVTDHPVCAILTNEIIDRMGPTVNVLGCEAEPLPGPWTRAMPEAAARVGVPSWFTLTGPGQTARIQATLHVDAAHLRAVRPLARGRTVASDDVRLEDGSLEGARFDALPGVTVAGARVVRAVEAGAVVQRLDVLMPPMIKAGQPVVAVVRIGAVEVTASMTAVDAGHLGDAIRIAHRDRKRVLQARVVGPGRVEVRYDR